MSIIYEALKKIEKTVNKAPLPQGKSGTEKISIAKHSPPLPAYIVIILAILAIMFGAGLVAHLLLIPKIKGPKKTLTQEPIQQADAPSPANSPKPIEEEKPKTAPPLALTLNGVYLQRDQPYALINNRIVKAGDNIHGAIVKEIRLEKVTLESEGKVITLVNPEK